MRDQNFSTARQANQGSDFDFSQNLSALGDNALSTELIQSGHKAFLNIRGPVDDG